MGKKGILAPKVSVIVPTWNKREYCFRCLTSVLELNYPKEQLTIWVVDNGSTDGTVEAIGQKFPEVRILQLKTNRGFGAAINKGITASHGKYILVLDNDVVLDKNALRILVAVAERNSDFGVLSGKLYDGLSGRRIQTFFGYIDEETFQVTRVGAGQQDQGQFDKLTVADYVPLGAALVRRLVFERVGLLDERYFVYFEDTDFLFRCKRAGVKVAFIPEAYMWHAGSASLGKVSPKIIYYLQRNNMRIRRKFNGMKIYDHISNLKLFVSVFLAMLFSTKNRINCRAAMMGILDFYRGRFGEAPDF